MEKGTQDQMWRTNMAGAEKERNGSTGGDDTDKGWGNSEDSADKGEDTANKGLGKNEDVGNKGWGKGEDTANKGWGKEEDTAGKGWGKGEDTAIKGWGKSEDNADKQRQDHKWGKPEDNAGGTRGNGTFNAKPKQTEHHTAIAAALAAVVKKVGGEKVSKASKAAKSAGKGYAKGGVTWEDGGESDRERGYHRRGGWEEEGDRDDGNWNGGYDDWHEGQGESSTWGPTEGEWVNHQEYTRRAAGQSSTYWSTPAPAAPSRPAAAQPAKAGWMSWGEEARKLAKVTHPPAQSSVGTRNVLSPQQRSQILGSLLNQPNQSHSAQQQASSNPYAPWGYTSQSDQNWGRGQATGNHSQPNQETWNSGYAKAGQWGDQWVTGSAKSGHLEQNERSQKKTQRHSLQPEQSKAGKKGKKTKEQEWGHNRGRSQSRNSAGWGEQWGDNWDNDGDEWGWGGDQNDWGNDRNNDWGNDRNNDWSNDRNNDWRNDRNNDRRNDWNNDGDDWKNDGNKWEDDGKNDWNNDWGNYENDQGGNDDYDAWGNRVHFSPKSASGPPGPTYSMPSKTLAHAYSTMPGAPSLHRGPVQNTMNEYADVRFVESKGTALEPVKQALFGQARLAKDRIHWMFSPDKDERVASLLNWIQNVSYNLGSFGVRIFMSFPVFVVSDGS
jgi:hypothetical protein